MIVGLKSNGKFTGVDPSAPNVVYADRDALGDWEKYELLKRDDGFFTVRAVVADVQLSQQPDGSFQTRPVGTDGPYELFFATDQPDGASLLYRYGAPGDVGFLLTIEATS